MSEHTPGPWMPAAKGSTVLGWPIVAPSADGRIICDITSSSDADANLIAAAPDLLEALEEIVIYAGGADNALEDEYVMDRVYTAIAKARGRHE